MSAALVARALEHQHGEISLEGLDVQRRPIAVVIDGDTGEVGFVATETLIGSDAGAAMERLLGIPPADVGNPHAAILRQRLTSSGVYEEDGISVAHLAWAGDAHVERRGA